MLYRRLGKIDSHVSVLGFGCMRLPIRKNERNSADIWDPKKDIDEEEAFQMVQYAINHGINYFDSDNSQNPPYSPKGVKKSPYHPHPGPPPSRGREFLLVF
jgi:predicted aldo/keto reductase-like oxidoreductase